MVAIKTQLLDELNEFLDGQVDQITQTLHQLDILRAAVIRRDSEALDQLMEQVRLLGEQKKKTQMIQNQLQQKLAVFCECPVEQVNVSRLCERLSQEDRHEIQLKQCKLQQLITKLNNECRSAELMLRECARFNRLLLSSLVGKDNQMRTYTAQGKEQWNLDCDLMNMKM